MTSVGRIGLSNSKSHLINYALVNPSDMDSRDWSHEALKVFRVRLRTELNRLEGVVPKAAFKLADIEEEAATAVTHQIVDIIQRGDVELAVALVAEWDLNIQDFRLDNGLKAIGQQAAKEESRKLLQTAEFQRAFEVCDAWEVDSREVLTDTLSLLTGHASSKAVVAGFDHGVLLLAEVEAWFMGGIESRGDWESSWPSDVSRSKA